jgi:hypothetical protein
MSLQAWETEVGDHLAFPRIPRGIGEIKPIGSRDQGHRQLLGRSPGMYPGRRALVTYDRTNGAVQMRLLRHDGTLGPTHAVGNVRTNDLKGLTPTQFGNSVENRVRNLVLWATGRGPRYGRRAKRPSATGPDIIFREYAF